MKISFLQNIYNTNIKNDKNCSVPFRPQSNNLAPLSRDCVSFGMKKSQLNEFDLACANQYKAPIEKFKTKQDFNDWANEKLEQMFSLKKLDSKTADEYVKEDKDRIIGEWKQVITNKNEKCIENPSLSLAVFSSLISDLAYDSKDLPEEYNEKVFDDTVSEIEQHLKANKNYSFNFIRKYKENIKASYILEEKLKQGLDPDKDDIFWIKIPSKINAPENYDENVKRLKALSSDFWCTKHGYKARTAIQSDDFYLCMKNNEAKLGVRMHNGQVFDVQGKMNDFYMPFKYATVLEEMAKDNNFSISQQSQLPKELNRAKKAMQVSKDIGHLIKNHDYIGVMKYYGLEPKMMDNGLLEISHFDGYPEELNYFKKYKMSEKSFISKIGKIDGNANFASTTLEDTMNITEITGNANFTDSKVKHLSNIKKIGGDLRLYNSEVTDIGELEEIGGSLNCFGKCQLENLGKLKHIHKDALLTYKQLDYAHQLETIGNREVIASRLACK